MKALIYNDDLTEIDIISNISQDDLKDNYDNWIVLTKAMQNKLIKAVEKLK